MDVVGNELTAIYWPNGGWLDQSHFCCAEFDENGYTSFSSDKGYDYEVTLTSEGPCSYVSGSNPESDENDDSYEEEGQEEKENSKEPSPSVLFFKPHYSVIMAS